MNDGIDAWVLELEQLIGLVAGWLSRPRDAMILTARELLALDPAEIDSWPNPKCLTNP